MVIWVCGGIFLALAALGAELFARYRRASVELDMEERAIGTKAEEHKEVAEKLRAEIPVIETEIGRQQKERAGLEKDLNWERDNFDELSKRHELRHVGRQQVDREGDG